MPKGLAQKETDDTEGDEPVVEKDKHRWDAADLEKVCPEFKSAGEIGRRVVALIPDAVKVTDFHEDRDEMNVVSRESLGNLKASSQPERTKIVIRSSDIQLIADELEVSRAVAERKLLESVGDVKAAMKSIMGID